MITREELLLTESVSADLQLSGQPVSAPLALMLCRHMTLLTARQAAAVIEALQDYPVSRAATFAVQLAWDAQY